MIWRQRTLFLLLGFLLGLLTSLLLDALAYLLNPGTGEVKGPDNLLHYRRAF